MSDAAADGTSDAGNATPSPTPTSPPAPASAPNAWLKLSSAEYSPEALAVMLQQLEPGILQPEAIQHQAEHLLAMYLGVKSQHVLLTNSCTSALAICYHFLRRGRGLEAPILTWPATYAYAKHKHLVDVDENGWPRYSLRHDFARVVVSLWGRRPPKEVLRSARVDEGGAVILDAAHAFGSGLDFLSDGFVDAVCYSFGPAKEVPCVRGGAIISPYITDDWRAFRDSGTLGRFGLIPNGQNYEIPEPFAALLSKQLKHVGDRRSLRQVILQRYLESNIPYALLTYPGESSGHLAVIDCIDAQARNYAQSCLLRNSIQSGVHYELPLWVRPTDFPMAHNLSSRILSIPCHTHMSPADVERVISALSDR